jgi:hypothetical protein
MAALDVDDYDALLATVAEFLKRGDLTTQIPGLIHLAEKSVEKRLRYRAGSETTSSWDATGVISAFATANGGAKTEVTSAGHGLSDDDKVRISSSVSYNGLHIVSASAANTFEIETDFVADDGASVWRKLSAMRAGDDLIAVPTGCLEPLHLRMETDPIRYCEVVSLNKFTQIMESNTSGIPQGILPYGTVIYLAPAPSSIIHYTLFYRAKVAYLKDGAGAATTWLLTEAPDVLLYGALAHAAPFIKNDERLPMWNAIFQTLLADFARQQWRRRTGGGELRCQPDFDVP